MGPHADGIQNSGLESHSAQMPSGRIQFRKEHGIFILCVVIITIPMMNGMGQHSMYGDDLKSYVGK